MAVSKQGEPRKVLFEMATSERSLNEAWLRVKPHLKHSKDKDTRSAESIFSRDVPRNITLLQRDLRSGRFIFEPQRGVLKRKKAKVGEPTKAPRPIVVSPARSRIVQRAILDVCQSSDGKITRRLGRIPEVINTPTSVGGLPGRGVREAIGLISNAIAAGATWYFRSDIKTFYQKISKTHIRTFLDENIRERAFVDIFMKALETELINTEELAEFLHIFPLGNVGIPQGSSLSAFCANIVLKEFDEELNRRGILTVRYLDDFVILGCNRRAVLKATSRARELLEAIGMQCHEPGANSNKAGMGEIREGFEFLSFRINDENVFPSRRAQQTFLDDIKLTIHNAKKTLKNIKSDPRRNEPRFIQVAGLLDDKIRGWGDAFSATTNRIVFAQLDSKLQILINEFLEWFVRLSHGCDTTYQRRLLGVALLIDTDNQACFPTMRRLTMVRDSSSNLVKLQPC